MEHMSLLDRKVFETFVKPGEVVEMRILGRVTKTAFVLAQSNSQAT